MVNLLGTLQSGWRGLAMLRCSVKGCPAVKGPRARSGRLFPGNPGVCSAPGGLLTPRRNPNPRSEPHAVQTPSFIRVIESPSPPPPGAPPSRRGTAGVRGLSAEGAAAPLWCPEGGGVRRAARGRHRLRRAVPDAGAVLTGPGPARLSPALPAFPIRPATLRPPRPT